MFIRVYRKKKSQEILINVDHISKIEVEYAERGDDGNYYHMPLEDGISDSKAVRMYRVQVGGDLFVLGSNPDCPVMKVLEEIYKNSIKGRSVTDDSPPQ